MGFKRVAVKSVGRRPAREDAGIALGGEGAETGSSGRSRVNVRGHEVTT